MFAAFGEAGAAVAAAIDAQRALVDRRLARRTAPSASGWACTRARRTSPATTTAGSTSTGRPGSRPSGTAGRSSLSGTTAALVADGAAGRRAASRDLGAHRAQGRAAPGALYQLDVPGPADRLPAAAAPVGAVGNLPDRLTTFIGRAADLARARRAARTTRLVTLTGPGGIGKTSLGDRARPAAARRLPGRRLARGLDGHRRPGRLVTPTIARTLGLFDGPTGRPPTRSPAFLADRSLLLVLDNFEHLLEAAPATSPSSSGGLAGLEVVVTSRAPLHVGGEQEYPVRPLPVEAASARDRPADRPDLDAATRLFIDRARAVRPDWQPGAGRCRSSTRSARCSTACRSASSWPRPGCRCCRRRPSATGWRPACRCPGRDRATRPARQRTLEAAVAWSHDLLSADERATFHELAVFEGGFDVDQAELVIDAPGAARGDALDRLIALAEHSLIARDQTWVGDAGRLAGSGVRFALLKTVHGYALDRLIADGREEELRRRHAVRLLEVAEAAEQHLWPPNSRPGSIDWSSIRPTCGRPCAGASTPARPIWRSDSSRLRGGIGSSPGSWRKGATGRRPRSRCRAPMRRRPPGCVRLGGRAASRTGGRSASGRPGDTRAACPCPTIEGYGGHGRCLVNLASATYVAGTVTNPSIAARRRDAYLSSSATNGASSTAATGASRTRS